MRCILILLAAAAAAAQTLPNAVPMPAPQIQYLNAQGQPLAGAYLCTFAAGTSTPLATYIDSTAAIPNTDPIVLDVNGRASVWIGPQLYKFVLYVGGNGLCPGSGAVQWSQDNVTDTALYFANFVKTAGTAAIISYTYPGAGAVNRTAASRLADQVSTFDFGAHADGMTDDSTALTAAFTAASSANKELYFPPGNYYINNQTAGLLISNFSGNVTFAGGARLMFANTANKGLVLSGATNARFTGLRAIYASTPTVRTSGNGAIICTGCSNTEFDNTIIENSPDAGLNIYQSDKTKVNGVYVTNTLADGLTAGNSTNTTISNVIAYSTGDDSVSCVSYQAGTVQSANFTATNLVLLNVASGIGIHGCQNYTISNFVNNASYYQGVAISDQSSFDEGSYFSDNGVISDGLIINAGSATPPGTSGLYGFAQGMNIYADYVIPLHHIRLSNITVIGGSNTYAGFTSGYGGGASAAEYDITATNLKVLGLSMTTALAAFNFEGISMDLSDSSASSSNGFGFAFRNCTRVFGSGLRAYNVALTSGSHRVVWLNNVTTALIKDVELIDDQGTATGYVFEDDGTTAAMVTGIESEISNGSVTVFNGNPNGILWQQDLQTSLTVMPTPTSGTNYSHWNLYSGGFPIQQSKQRWGWLLTGAESGSNAGSVLTLTRWSDTGTFLLNVVSFSRQGGISWFDPFISQMTTNLSAPGGSTNYTHWELQSGSSARWEHVLANQETGSNVGSDYVLGSFADNGTTYLGNRLQITRTNGALTLGGYSGDAGQAACFTTNGALGHCTSAVNSSGACTCTTP